MGDEGVSATGDHADFHVVYVVELPVGGEELIQCWRCGIFHVDDRESLLARGNVSVGALDINVASVGERHEDVGLRLGLRKPGNVQNFHAVVIDHKGVAKLDSDGARIV